jgi:hypothetical protein
MHVGSLKPHERAGTTVPSNHPVKFYIQQASEEPPIRTETLVGPPQQGLLDHERRGPSKGTGQGQYTSPPSAGEARRVPVAASNPSNDLPLTVALKPQTPVLKWPPAFNRSHHASKRPCTHVRLTDWGHEELRQAFMTPKNPRRAGPCEEQ